MVGNGGVVKLLPRRFDAVRGGIAADQPADLAPLSREVGPR
jgi:hypothetical protein